MNKIIDCITYFRESFVTKLRIEILKDVVDKFIICESLYDHRSRPKKINFESLYIGFIGKFYRYPKDEYNHDIIHLLNSFGYKYLNMK